MPSMVDGEWPSEKRQHQHYPRVIINTFKSANLDDAALSSSSPMGQPQPWLDSMILMLASLRILGHAWVQQQDLPLQAASKIGESWTEIGPSESPTLERAARSLGARAVRGGWAGVRRER